MSIEELKKLRRKAQIELLTEEDIKKLSELIKMDDLEIKNSSNGQESKLSNKQFVKTLPNQKNKYEDNGIFNQQGFSNILFLSSLTLISEMLFIVLSVAIFAH